MVAFAAAPLVAIDADRDFSGRWVLDPQASSLSGLPSIPERFLSIVQNDQVFRCTATADDRSESVWIFTSDGQESRYTLGKEQRKTIGKWEGSALLLNTLVGGPQDYTIPDYTIMDRWQLSDDRSVFTIERQIVAKSGETDGRIVYRREGQSQLTVRGPAPAPLPPRLNAPPANAPQAAASAAPFTLPAGTHIPLTLVNPLNTRQSKEGDGVYLETAFPVFAGGRVVIPRGSYVQGTVTRAQPPGKDKSKGELFIRFDSLTLPNGVARDFRARLDSADHGQVDRAEGTIGGGGNGANEAGTVVRDGGMGAGVGALGGMAAGHMGMGMGIGSAAGGVAGLASVIARRNAGVVLPRGTSMEMVLDRDLTYTPEELRF